ncbi:MAG: hypothetical protein E7504_01140 [Ruminococcus sp.]|nr:hypothetical protein [Ruminococcus sp.]
MLTKRNQIFLLLTAMTISAVIIMLSAAKGVELQKSSAAAKNASMAAHEHVGFVLGEFGGKLALFRENSKKPYRILDMETYLLSEEDLELIRSGGIIVDSEEELERLIEDWDS